jgi:WD40 repeat protein
MRLILRNSAIHPRPGIELFTNQNQCWGLAWSPNDDEVATVGDDGSVRIWDVSVKAQQIRLHGREGRLTMDNDRRLLFSDKPLTTSELQDLAVQIKRSPSHA